MHSNNEHDLVAARFMLRPGLGELVIEDHVHSTDDDDPVLFVLSNPVDSQAQHQGTHKSTSDRNSSVFALHPLKEESDQSIPAWGQQALEDIAFLKFHAAQQKQCNATRAPEDHEIPAMRLDSTNEKHAQAVLPDIPDVYKLEESVWDAILVLFTPKVGKAASLFGLVLLLINLLVQVFFTQLVLTHLTDPAFSNEDVTELRRWRTNIAHDSKYLDPFARTTLAARVCGMDSGVEMSGLQAQYVKDLNAFLEESFLDGFTTGHLVMTFCCFVWCMSIVGEFSSCFRVLKAVWENVGVGSCNIAISCTRAVLFSLVQVVRLMIAGVLLYAGVLYLCHSTISIPDLLLNMVALEFILDLDERLYSFAPRQLQAGLDEVESLQMKFTKSKYFGRADCLSVGKFVIIMLAIPIIMIMVIDPTVQQLWEASDALCSGYTDFAFTVDVRHATNWAKVPPSNATDGSRKWRRPESELDVLKFNERVIDEVLAWPSADYQCPKANCTTNLTDPVNISTFNLSRTHKPACCWVAEGKWSSLNDGMMSLSNVGKMSVSEYTESFFGDCDERSAGMHVGDQKYEAVRNYYTFVDAARDHDAAGNNTVHPNSSGVYMDCSPACSDPYRPWCRNGTCVTPTCHDVLPYCYETSHVGIVARMLCPAECGCDTPISTQMSTLASSGCPTRCRHTPEYIEDMNRPCEDVAKTDPRLQLYASELPKLATGTTTMIDYAEWWANMLREKGCEAVNSLKNEYGFELWRICGMLSNETQREIGPFNAEVRGLQYICPDACKCSASDSYGCPTQCL